MSSCAAIGTRSCPSGSSFRRSAPSKRMRARSASREVGSPFRSDRRRVSHCRNGKPRQAPRRGVDPWQGGARRVMDFRHEGARCTRGGGPAWESRLDPAARVLSGIGACVQRPPRMTGTTHLEGLSMFTRRLAPQEDKLDRYASPPPSSAPSPPISARCSVAPIAAAPRNPSQALDAHGAKRPARSRRGHVGYSRSGLSLHVQADELAAANSSDWRTAGATPATAAWGRRGDGPVAIRHAPGRIHWSRRSLHRRDAPRR